MSKGWYCAIRIIMYAVAGVAAYIMIQLLLAWLVVNRSLTESRIAGVQIITGGIAAMLSGFLALKDTGWRLASVLTSMMMALVAIAFGGLIYGGVSLDGEALVRFGAMISGGMLSCLLAGREKNARKRRGMKSGRHK